MNRDFIIYFKHSDGQNYSVTESLLIPNTEVLVGFTQLTRIVTEYFLSINKEFNKSIIIDNKVFSFEFNLSASEYVLIEQPYKGFDIKYHATNVSLWTTVVPFEQMLDAFPDVNPYKEFHL